MPDGSKPPEVCPVEEYHESTVFWPLAGIPPPVPARADIRHIAIQNVPCGYESWLRPMLSLVRLPLVEGTSRDDRSARRYSLNLARPVAPSSLIPCESFEYPVDLELVEEPIRRTVFDIQPVRGCMPVDSLIYEPSHDRFRVSQTEGCTVQIVPSKVDQQDCPLFTHHSAATSRLPEPLDRGDSYSNIRFNLGVLTAVPHPNRGDRDFRHVEVWSTRGAPGSHLFEGPR